MLACWYDIYILICALSMLNAKVTVNLLRPQRFQCWLRPLKPVVRWSYKGPAKNWFEFPYPEGHHRTIVITSLKTYFPIFFNPPYSVSEFLASFTYTARD